ncbi:MAG: hypothetical protein P4M07_27165 [Xanthobacteraceae bacterium]|nr:hypothetical protein [Xanthobacteraceae bacterium]
MAIELDEILAAPGERRAHDGEPLHGPARQGRSFALYLRFKQAQIAAKPVFTDLFSIVILMA